MDNTSSKRGSGAQPTPPHSQAVTRLLERAQQGDSQATNELFPLVYDELRQIASRFLADERAGHTLQPTALVNEAYMRLVGPQGGERKVEWDNRAHFFGAAARAIRRILTDHARTKNSLKRGGAAERVSLDAVSEGVAAPDAGHTLATGSDGPDFVAIDKAMEKLAAMDAQKAQVVELRFFGGLTVEQTAAALGVSPSTVARDWQFAKLWLHRELAGGAGT